MINALKPAGSKEIAHHYDDLDPFYRRYWGHHLHHGLWETGKESVEEATENLLEALCSKMEMNGSAQEICDVGCGYGSTSRYLSDNFEAKVIGLTLSSVQAEHARGLSQPKHQIEYRVEDWLKNSFEDQLFHSLISIESSAHMTDKALYFSEGARVLKTGGKFGICAWLSKENPGPIETKTLLRPICDEGRLPGLGTKNEYLEWANQAGLELVSYGDLSKKVMRTWSICARRMIGSLVTDPELRRYLFASKGKTEKKFGWLVLRLWTAYQTGTLQYGMFVFKKASPH